MSDQEMQGRIDAVHAQLGDHIKAMLEHHARNGKAAFHLDRKLKASPDLLKQFIADPVGFAKLEGMETEEGFHLHFINEKNEYFPPEGDALSQLEQKKTPVWGRLEIRYAVGPGCIAACTGCTC